MREIDLRSTVGIRRRLSNTPTTTNLNRKNSPHSQLRMRNFATSAKTFARGARRALGRGMKAETKIQLALAVLGVPAIFYLWRPDSKWPNPFALQSPSPNSPTRGERFLSYLGLQPPRKPPQ